MKAKEVRDKTKAELIQLKLDLSKELIKLRMQGRMGQLPQTSKIGSLRKDIARIMTIMKEVRA